MDDIFRLFCLIRLFFFSELRDKGAVSLRHFFLREDALYD